MGFLKINLTNIVSPNDFIVSYKKGESVGNLNTGFTRYPDNSTIYTGLTSTIIVSGITLNYGDQYWFKIEEYNTGRTDNPFVIENIHIHNEEYFTYYCPEPVPTPTPTPTSGPVPTPTATPTLTPTLTSTPTLTATNGTIPDPTPTPTVTSTPTGIKTISLAWNYTDGTSSPNYYNAFKTSYWNLGLSSPLEGYESITVTINYTFNNQAINVITEGGILSLSEGVTSGNIIGLGNVGQDSLLSTFPSTKSGVLTQTLTASNQLMRLGLNTSIIGDYNTNGTTITSIIMTVNSYLVNVIYDNINPSVSVTLTPTPTPTPTSCGEIPISPNLQYSNISSVDVCSVGIFTPYYGNTSDLSTTTILYSGSCVIANPGWYLDGITGNWRQWTGLAFIDSGTCV